MHADALREIVVSRTGVDGPGCVARVLRDGEVAFDLATGVTRLDDPEPLTTQTRFYVGSLAKQFVAACATLADRDEMLSLDAVVSACVPNMPAWGDRITLRQLIHHTAGIPDPDRSQRDGPSQDGIPAWGNPDLVVQLTTIQHLESEPGSRYAYSNRGYLLLAEAIARTTGSPLSAYARDRIFEPLGMGSTFFRDRPTDLPADAARGHFRATDGEIHVEPARFHAVGAGGLWTTLDDLSRWDALLGGSDPLTQGWLPERLITHGRLNDGTLIHYAFGLSVRSHRSLPIVSHGGSFPGWEAKMIRFPVQRTSVIVLANGEEFDVSAMALAIADEVLADQIDPSAPTAAQTLDA
jgi:CubicO group peptidase (beta-lactamase class C family)